MTYAPWLTGFEFAASIGVAGLLVRVPFAGVEHEDCDVVGQRDPAMLERAAVEQQRRPLATEERRRLVQDSRRHADGSLLRALARRSQVERINIEAGDVAKGHCYGHHESAGRAESGSLREVRLDSSSKSDIGTTQQL